MQAKVPTRWGMGSASSIFALAVLPACGLLLSCGYTRHRVPDTVRDQIRTKPPVSGLTVYSMLSPPDPQVTWIAAAKDKLFAGSRYGLFQRDFSSGRWTFAGKGLPDGYASRVVATDHSFYAIGRLGRIYRRGAVDEDWVLDDPDLAIDGGSDPTAIAGTIGDAIIVGRAGIFACQRERDAAWRTERLNDHTEGNFIRGFHSTQNELYAYGHYGGTLDRFGHYKFFGFVPVWRVDPQKCSLIVLPRVPSIRFFGVAGVSELQVSLDGGLFRWHDGKWVRNGPPYPSDLDFEGKLMGAGDVLALKTPKGWLWSSTQEGTWRPLSGKWREGAFAHGQVFVLGSAGIFRFDLATGSRLTEKG